MKAEWIDKIEEIDNGYIIAYVCSKAGIHERKIRHCNTKDEVVYEIKELL